MSEAFGYLSSLHIMHLTIGSTVYGNTYKLGALQKNACDNKRMPVITKKVHDGCMLERQ